MLEKYGKNLVVKFCLGICFSLILFFAQGVKIPYLDNSSDSYFKDAISKAGVAYASTRGVNALISMIQNSQLQLEPAGVGFSLAIGEVLDPINDMTERLSNVLVLAITSLGLQKLLYEMSISIVPPLLAVFLLLFSLTLWIKNAKIKIFQAFLLSFSLLLIVARVSLPFASLANEYLYQNFFATKIVQSQQALHVSGVDADKLSQMSVPTQQNSSFWNKISNSTQLIQEKSAQFKEAFTYTLENAGNLIDNLLNLTFLYIGVFLIQVIFLPLFIFWIFWKISKSFI